MEEKGCVTQMSD